MKDEYWTSPDCLKTESLEILFKNKYFLHHFRLISTLILFGNRSIEKSKRCNLNFVFQNLSYLELYNCCYDNFDRLQSDKLNYFYLDAPCTLVNLFTNFNSLNHVDLFFVDALDKYFNQKFPTKLITLHTEKYLDRKDCNRLIRYCPKLEILNCKFSDIDLLYLVINRLKNLRIIRFYTADCSELNEEERSRFRQLIESRPDLEIYFCGVKVDNYSLNFLFDFISVKEYHNWTTIETDRLSEISNSYCMDNRLDYLTDYLTRMTTQIRLFNNFKLNNQLLLKFNNLKKVLLSRYKPDNFYNLIINLPHLNHLTLNSCFLTKQDLDYLPIYCQKLTDLIINSSKLNDFEFIYNLKNLQQLVLLLTKPIELDDFISFASDCDYLDELRANVNYSISNTEYLIDSVKLNKTIRDKVFEYPMVKFKFVILHPDYFNSIEINSEMIRY